MSLLEVTGLSKRFGGLQAVGGLDLSLAQGEISMAILGLATPVRIPASRSTHNAR